VTQLRNHPTPGEIPADTVTGATTFTQVVSSRRGGLVGVGVFLTETGSRAAKLGRMMVRWSRETVTPVGWLIVVSGIVLLPLGFLWGWSELRVPGLVALVLLVIAIPFLFGARSYEVDFALPQDRVVAGTVISADIVVANGSPRPQLPGRVDIPVGASVTELLVPFLLPGAHMQSTIPIPTERRGVLNVGPIRTVRTDPLGALRREIEWADVRKVFVHPATVSVPSTSAGFIRDLEGDPTTVLVDSDISFHAIREYAPGDGQRHIHWKSTAKTGQLMVRQFEESRRERIVIVLALNPQEFATEDEFEMAVSAVGSLGVRAIRDGRDLAVVVSSEIYAAARNTVKSVRRLNVRAGVNLLDELSVVNPTSNAMTLDEVCRLTTQVVHDMSIAFVMCGSTLTARDLQILRLTFPRAMQVVAVVCNPASEPSFRSAGGVSIVSIGVLDDFRKILSRQVAS
jgi:uncharacterized protein (DUF58 family)